MTTNVFAGKLANKTVKFRYLEMVALLRLIDDLDEEPGDEELLRSSRGKLAEATRVVRRRFKDPASV